MKKHIFLGLAAFSMLFATGCANETSESVNDAKGTVSFKTTLGKQTKVGEFKYSDWSDGDKLNVFAYPVGSGTLVNTFELTLGSGVWTYDPPFNQPGYALRYYSWYPSGAHVADADSPKATDASYSFKYVVRDVANQQDLIAARDISSGSAVVLPFRHTLSQVNFGVANLFGVKIEISGISVNGVKNSGTYTFDDTTPWTGQAGAGSYVYTPLANTNITSPEASTGSISYMGNGNGEYGNANALMLMPQTFSAAGDGTITFNYKLTTKDANGDDVDTSGSITANLCDFETAQWAVGKRYLYVIDFADFLVGGEISFTVSVTDWTNDSDNTVAETIYVANINAASIEAAIGRHSTANGVNANLKTFPIAVAEDIDADVTIKNVTGFDPGDKIVIEFPNSSSVEYLLLHTDLENDWSRSESGRVVAFTKKTV